jgi:23S rRNA pseudouridine1911/1915/1917 synthase
MSALRHPLLGDATYGFKTTRLPDVDVLRVMLHSTELRVAHPESGVEMRFEANLPDDFASLVERLRARAP